MIFRILYHGDRLGNEQYDEGEKFIDLNDNENDDAESFTDEWKPKYDKGEKFKDIGNGKWMLLRHMRIFLMVNMMKVKIL